jgi:hypothetical protein
MTHFIGNGPKQTAGGGCDSSINNNTNKYTSDIAYTDGYINGYIEGITDTYYDLFNTVFANYFKKNFTISTLEKQNGYEITGESLKLNSIFKIDILFIINKENKWPTFRVTKFITNNDGTFNDEPINSKLNIIQFIEFLKKVIQDY